MLTLNSLASGFEAAYGADEEAPAPDEVVALTTALVARALFTTR